MISVTLSLTDDNAACTSKGTAAQRLLSLALIDMAKDNSQSSKRSKFSSRFFKRPISPTPSEPSQGNSSKSWTLWPKSFSKSQSTTPYQSTSSLPLVSSTVDSHETAFAEHGIISPFVLRTLASLPEARTTASFSVVQGD